MASPHLDIKDVAHLARVRLSTEEESRFSGQLDHILGFIAKLSEVNVEGIEPTAHAFPLVNVARADVVRSSLPHDEAMQNAPSRTNGLFQVPKIVE